MSTPCVFQDRRVSDQTLKPTVLCVDDDPQMLNALKLLLDKHDVRAIPITCGWLGAMYAHEKLPDLIITDIRMSQGDGPALLKELKSNSRMAHIPVIVLTGCRGSRISQRMRKLGAECVLYKPTAPQVLLEEIGRYIPLKHLQIIQTTEPFTTTRNRGEVR